MTAAAPMLPAGKFAGHVGKDASCARMEDEVKLAEMEGRLREMVVGMLRPTVQRTTQLNSVFEELRAVFREQQQTLKRIAAESQIARERAELVLMFKGQMEEFSASLRDTDSRLSSYEKATLERLENVEHKTDHQGSLNNRTDRTVDRLGQDLEHLILEVKAMDSKIDASLLQNRDYISTEVDGVKLSLKEVGEQLQRMCDEVWGPEEPEEVAPPSLRRLDMQMRKTSLLLVDALHDLTQLRRLDMDMLGVTKHQSAIDVHLGELSASCKVLRERVEKIAVDTKSESKMAANKMAAFTASLMKDVRVNFQDEVKTLQQMQQEVQQFVRETQSSTGGLDKMVQSISRQVEAAHRELRADLDGLEGKRRRDKQGFQESVQGLQGRLGAAIDAAEATLRGLEHVSNVVSMALQSERMSVALDLQDFVERKDAPYVGVRSPAERGNKGRAIERRREGLDPSLLVRLAYQPQPVAFHGRSFDRPQLLALREKLVHLAQEVLLKGPSARAARHHGMLFDPSLAEQPAPPVAAQLLGVSADFPCAGRRAAMSPMARPGSRGQPSARGSPLLEGDFRPASGEGGHGSAREGAGPSQVCAEFVDAAGQAMHLPALAGSFESERVQRNAMGLAELPAPLTAR